MSIFEMRENNKKTIFPCPTQSCVVIMYFWSYYTHAPVHYRYTQ